MRPPGTLPTPTPAALRRALTTAIGVVLTLLAVVTTPAVAGVVNGGLPGARPGNPLAGLPWGVYHGPLDGVYPAYLAARGPDRRLLGRIALRPSVHWFGSWDTDSTAGAVARQYIRASTGGRRNVMAQLAVFRVEPWEQAACSQVPTAAQQQSYQTWIDNFAAGIGSSRVALILQPDLPFALCAPEHSLAALQLVAYAAQRFSALPYTTVYIDVGAADWAHVNQAAWLLEHAGIQYARGFALNDTHFDSTGNELVFGAEVSRALSAAHLPGRHFVVNTAENGAPFIYYKYHGNRADPAVCASRTARACATLGIPPTWNTAAVRWGLSPGQRRIAARLADAYLWVGRPWLYHGNYPFDLTRALGLARWSPYW